MILDPYHYDDSDGCSDFTDGGNPLGGKLGAQLEWGEDPSDDRWVAHLVYPAAMDLYTRKAAQMTCVISKRSGTTGEPPVFVLMTQGAHVGSRRYSEFDDLGIAMLLAQGWARGRFYLLAKDMPEGEE
jgi:hypothetical protein